MRNATAQVRNLMAGRESHRREHRRSLIFSCADCLFLILVGVINSLEMHLIHMLGLHLVLTLAVGMIVAMTIQTMLSLAVAPILGSIESMVPSMVAGMIIPMFVCFFDLVGITMRGSGVLTLGIVGGIASSVLLKGYGRRCKKCFCCEFPQKEG